MAYINVSKTVTYAAALSPLGQAQFSALLDAYSHAVAAHTVRDKDSTAYDLALTGEKLKRFVREAVTQAFDEGGNKA